MFRKFELLGELVDADASKTAVKCPWRGEHSDGNEPWRANDSSTVIFAAADGDGFPGFHCMHVHCAGRGLKEVLRWFEQKQAGVVDEHCRQQRVWQPGQGAADGRPRVVLPGRCRPASTFAEEAGRVLAPKQCWFEKAGEIVTVRQLRLSEKVKCLAFHRLQPIEVCTAIEEHLQTGKLTQKDDEAVFVPETMLEQTAKMLLHAPQFIQSLPPIVRILDVPLPVLHQGEIVFPKPG